MLDVVLILSGISFQNKKLFKNTKRCKDDQWIRWVIFLKKKKDSVGDESMHDEAADSEI